MREELITQFTVKSSGMFSLEDSVTIQKLLKNASDDAFPVLMLHKVKRSIVVNVVLWLLLATSAFFLVAGLVGIVETAGVERWKGDLMMSSAMFAIALLIGVLVVVGLICLKPSKSKCFQEYSQILIQFQNR